MSVPSRNLTAATLTLFLSGCTYALHPHSEPVQEKLHLLGDHSGPYVIQVQDQGEIVVPTDGRVVVDVHALARACSVYLFGFIKTKNGAPERLPAIYILREGRVVRRLSLRTLHDLPLDPEGYRVLKL